MSVRWLASYPAALGYRSRLPVLRGLQRGWPSVRLASDKLLRGSSGASCFFLFSSVLSLQHSSFLSCLCVFLCSASCLHQSVWFAFSVTFQQGPVCCGILLKVRSCLTAMSHHLMKDQKGRLGSLQFKWWRSSHPTLLLTITIVNNWNIVKPYKDFCSWKAYLLSISNAYHLFIVILPLSLSHST